MNEIKQTFGIKAYLVTDGKTTLNHGEFDAEKLSLKR